MRISFYKYHGSGNDFILTDMRQQGFVPNEQAIKELCDRHFGIGADGLMMLMKDENHDFSMKYFNADGREGSMCGNGGRCIAFFAKRLGLISSKTRFNATDGVHDAEITASDGNTAQVKLHMNPVDEIKRFNDGIWLNTGSPHFVKFAKILPGGDITIEGKKYRYDERFAPQGTNVNFVQVNNDNQISVRTYERGVENETLSCGTGVIASAIAAHHSGKLKGNCIEVLTPGGRLNVSFEKNKGSFESIILEGPAVEVFKGEILQNE